MTNDAINLRLNEEELLTHEWLKDFFGLRDTFGEESQTIKTAEIVAYNVLRGTFGDNLKDIFKRESLLKLKERRAIQALRIEESKANTAAGVYRT